MNARGKSVDTTSLSIEQALKRGWIHRDYLAHVLRWNHVVKFLREGRRYKTAHVLDVGCGRECPLPVTLFSNQLTHSTGSYTGVDYGPIDLDVYVQHATEKGSFHASVYPKKDFAKEVLKGNTFTHGAYDVIVSFEVLEHVEPWHAFEMLMAMRRVSQAGATIFLSTPCFDRKMGAAANHVNEMTFEGFQALIYAAGFQVTDVWGTFASQKDYKKVMSPEERALFDRLTPYYDSNIVANLFAPLYPAQSRNCLWECAPATPDGRFLAEVKGAEHSSSDQWEKTIAKIRRVLK